MPRIIRITLVLAALFISAPPSLHAQEHSAALMQNAKNIAQHCPEQWEQQNCLSAISSASMDMTIDYAQRLDTAGKGAQLDNLKNLCAASTAATKGAYPAAAMRSAFVECINGITDIAQNTTIGPDPSQFQLLVVSVMCLDKNPHCARLEEQMKQYK